MLVPWKINSPHKIPQSSALRPTSRDLLASLEDAAQKNVNFFGFRKKYQKVAVFRPFFFVLILLIIQKSGVHQVEGGSLFTIIYKVFFSSQVVVWDFFHQPWVRHYFYKRKKLQSPPEIMRNHPPITLVNPPKKRGDLVGISG